MEHGSFAPLVMNTNGGFERECQHFYAKLSEKIAGKRDEHYSVVAVWVRRKIMLFNSVILWMRGNLSKLVNFYQRLQNVNFDTHPLHQSMPEEVRQCANIVKHLCVFIL